MLFSGQNKRLDSLKNQNHLQPISFASKGNITGIQKLESTTLQAGVIRISDSGDITGVHNLHATGLIKTDATLELSEFSTGGKVQAGGPLLTSASGFVSYTGVGLSDSDYGKSDLYFSRKYSCIIPDVYPPQVYIWSLTSEETTHLTITQGSKTYVYVFPIGRYASADICYTFNHTLTQSGEQIPLVMSYNTATDKFTITVDETIGAINEPPPYLDTVPNYKMEFTVLGKSLLLQRLGFFIPSNEEVCNDITSDNRILRSTVQTAFKEVAGFAQGFYSGGMKNNDLSPYWSPATHVWVGSEPSQTCKYKVMKAMTESRMSDRVGNEYLECETLSASALFCVSATLTSPYFECTDDDTPWVWQSTSSEQRAHYLPIITISNKGLVTIVGFDDSETFTEDEILCNSSSVVNIQSRNPKTPGVGPSISLEGSISNCLEASENIITHTTYASVKGIPSSSTQSDTVDENSGGQLVFLTTPIEGNVSLEAMRINEQQQVCIGTTPHSSENLYTCGNVYVEGSIGVSSCLIATKAQVTSLTSTDITTDTLVILGESSFGGDVHIVSSQVSVATSKATITENIQVSRSSHMTGPVDITGPLSVIGNSMFIGTTDVNGTFEVTNGTLLKKQLDVNDIVAFGNDVSIYKPLTVSGITTLEKNVNVGESLSVSEASLFDDIVGVSTSLTVSGDTILENNLDVEGLLTVNGSSTFDDTVTVNNTVQVNRKITANSDIEITGSESNIYNTTYTDPDVSVSRSLKVSGEGLAVDGGTKTDTLKCYNTSSGTYVVPLEIYAPSNTNTNAITGLIFGTENETEDCGILGFKYTASGSTSNKIVFFFDGDSDELLSLRADHTAVIDTLTVNGDITVSGKVLPTDIISTESLTNLGLPTSDSNLQYGERIRLWGSGTTSGYSIGIAPNVLWLTSNNTIAFYSNGSAIASVTSTGFNGVYPVGSVIWVAFNCINGTQGQTSIPIGYLVSNGAQVSRTTYATLYAVIGTIYGSGDGSTTFNIPDLRGAFVRGYNETSSGYDPSRTFGTSQGDAIRSHNHTVSIASGGGHDHGYWSPASGGWQSGGPTRGGGYHGWQATESESSHTHGASCSQKGSETRPCNYAMVGLIRYA